MNRSAIRAAILLALIAAWPSTVAGVEDPVYRGGGAPTAGGRWRFQQPVTNFRA
jgi:hypothetical protein